MDVRERMTLTIAGATYRYSAQREEDFVRVVGYSPSRAFQVVNELLDRPDAEAEMPAVVRRLRRLRDARRAQRSASRLEAPAWGRPVGRPVSRSM